MEEMEEERLKAGGLPGEGLRQGEGQQGTGCGKNKDRQTQD